MPSDVFKPLVGQEQVIELLEQVIQNRRIAPAYLFTGAKGVGRSLAARCFIKLLFSISTANSSLSELMVSPELETRLQRGNHPDLLWIEPTYNHQGKLVTVSEAATAGLKRKTPPQIRLEQIREVVQFLSRPPLEAVRSVIVVDQAETMAEPAANGLLKTLEEPGRATFILIAPSPESLLPTLVSRCQRIPFVRLSDTAMAQVLTQAGHAAVLTQPEVIAIAQGSPGAAIETWQQLQAIPTELLSEVSQPPRTLRHAMELARQIDKTLDGEAQLWLVTYLQQCYWQQWCSSETNLRSLQCSALNTLEKARQYLLSFVQPRLVWEVTLMELMESA